MGARSKRVSRRVELWTALAGLLAAVVTFGLIFFPGEPDDGMVQSDSPHQDNGCQVIGDDATVNCSVSDEATPPSVM